MRNTSSKNENTALSEGEEVFFFSFLFEVRTTLTQLIKVCVNAVDPGNRTHKPRFEKSGPLVYKAPVTTHVIL